MKRWDRLVYAPTRASEGCRQFAVLTGVAVVILALVLAAWSLGLR